MRKKTMVVALSLAIMVIAFAQAALAAPPVDKQSNSHAKAKVNETDDITEEVDGDVEENIKCTIFHKSHDITVSINAIPAHLRHGDDPSTIEGDGCPTEGTTQEQPEEMPSEGTTQAPEQGTINVQETEQEEDEQLQEGTTVGLQEEQEKQAETEDTATVETCDGESTELTANEEQVLNLHNEAREKQGLQSLCVDPALQKAARAHSKEVVKKDNSRRESNDGEDISARLKRFGYDSGASGENVARGSGRGGEPKEIFERWMKSSGHKENILKKSFREVGVGVASDDSKKGGKKKTVYTVDFGARQR